jgi:hypothetical protein
MDYVYIVRDGQNEELRYSLRSLAKNAPEGRVWLVGGKPDWFNGSHISVRDKASKFKNIAACLYAAASSNDISDDFILMNDDFFILENIANFLPLYGGTLASKIASYTNLLGPTVYSGILGRAMKYINSNGIKDPLDYDIHVPLEINKQKFLELVPHDSLAPRSVYGNLAAVGGTEITDVKTYNNPRYRSRSYAYDKDNSPFISSNDDSFSILLDTVLRDMFPEPSPYEV